jgi:hypothetical protein
MLWTEHHPGSDVTGAALGESFDQPPYRLRFPPPRAFEQSSRSHDQL